MIDTNPLTISLNQMAETSIELFSTHNQPQKHTMTVRTASRYMDTLDHGSLKRKFSSSSFNTAPAPKKMALRRQVSFDETQNQYHHIESYDCNNEQTKAMHWYTQDECYKFRDEVWVSSFKLISSVPKDLAEQWVEVLSDVYTSSRTTIHSAAATANLEARLTQVYVQTAPHADDFVGLEFHMLCPELKDDVASRKRSLYGIAQLRNSFQTTGGPLFTETQLFVMTRQLTRVSSNFAQQLARAQARANDILNSATQSY